MFEKEAEEFERRKHYRYEDNDYCGDIADGIIQAYQQGAEFGYNKANEWHDLRKDPNDLPDIHCLNWVIALYDNGTLWCRAKREKCVDGIFWVDSYHYQIYNVIAWKEIVFSKEIKEND